MNHNISQSLIRKIRSESSYQLHSPRTARTQSVWIWLKFQSWKLAELIRIENCRDYHYQCYIKNNQLDQNVEHETSRTLRR